MLVSFCLLNYNSYLDTIECIDSLLKQTCNKFYVVIVDNCSTNDSVQQITNYLDVKEENYKTVKYNSIGFESKNDVNYNNFRFIIITNTSNNGFSAGNNLAILFLKKHLECSHFILLNTDTVVVPDFFQLLNQEYIFAQNQNNQPIAMGVAEKSYFSKEITHFGYQFLHLPSGLVFSKCIFPSVKFICGACLMTDINAPLLNENYFLYYEDVDYTISLHKKNYKLIKTDKTYYFHKISSSMTNKQTMVKNQFESMWKFYKRNYKLYIPVVFITRILQYIVYFNYKKVALLLTTLFCSVDE